MKKTNLHSSVGGGSNTPLTGTLINKVKLEKSVLIDYISASLDFIKVEQITSREFSIDLYDPLLKQLLSYFGITAHPHELQKVRGQNGFSHALVIGEHIKLHYGLGQLNKNNKHPLNLIIKGQGCREFEKNMQGNWKDLLSFLLANGSDIKRFDNAIDDYSADEISIYEIEAFLKRYHYLSPMHNTQIITSTGVEDGLRVMTGYSITIGSSGSSQLQMYDKNLERKAKGFNTSVDTWYRYEMRLTGDKATNIAKLYVETVDGNNDHEYMMLAKSLLYEMLDLKIPKIKGKKTNDTNMKRWDTYPKWLAFLDSVEKIKHKSTKPDETSMIKKKKYFERSYATFLAEQELYQDSYPFQKWSKENTLDGLIKIYNEPIRLIRINNGRESQGMEKLTLDDVMQMIKDIQNELTYYEV